MSIVERERRNPHLLSGRITFAMFCSLFRRIFARIFPQLRVAKCLDSFHSHYGHPFLYIAIIKASLNCCGSSLAVQHMW